MPTKDHRDLRERIARPPAQKRIGFLVRLLVLVEHALLGARDVSGSPFD
ncbi:hypothetical protein LFT51_01360 [Mycobacterium intracellulare subsp. chimaera]|jgi:hypothetical protein|nr:MULTISPECIES: hypothetical protein [Mycobacterium avium complex (MAC)]MCA2247839.1 hypothetical protein [Mycobacterium intracellulare]QGK46705.1 hypothetical protein GJE02_01365 [Mycobacterium intracellulare subsp. chimaera]UCN04344.1 hypothetical protein LFT51_01360 [Mycobacterium intracellulare subsp. chimaera]